MYNLEENGDGQSAFFRESRMMEPFEIHTVEKTFNQFHQLQQDLRNA